MTTPADNNPGNVPGVVIVSVALISVFAIAGVVILSLAGKETTGVLTIMGVLSPFIVALLAIRNSQKIDAVRRQVNGKIDNLITDKANLEHQVSVAGLTPITATVSFDPDSTGPLPVVGADGETNPPTNPFSVAAILRRNNEGSTHHGR